MYASWYTNAYHYKIRNVRFQPSSSSHHVASSRYHALSIQVAGFVFPSLVKHKKALRPSCSITIIHRSIPIQILATCHKVHDEAHALVQKRAIALILHAIPKIIYATSDMGCEEVLPLYEYVSHAIGVRYQSLERQSHGAAQVSPNASLPVLRTRTLNAEETWLKSAIQPLLPAINQAALQLAQHLLTPKQTQLVQHSWTPKQIVRIALQDPRYYGKDPTSLFSMLVHDSAIFYDLFKSYLEVGLSTSFVGFLSEDLNHAPRLCN
jgi:hypothetical protein